MIERVEQWIDVQETGPERTASSSLQSDGKVP